MKAFPILLSALLLAACGKSEAPAQPAKTEVHETKGESKPAPQPAPKPAQPKPAQPKPVQPKPQSKDVMDNLF